MKKEYNFKNAERGKFYKAGTKIIPPIHLQPEILDYLAECAKAKGTTLNELVNELLKKDIEAIKAR